MSQIVKAMACPWGPSDQYAYAACQRSGRSRFDPNPAATNCGAPECADHGDCEHGTCLTCEALHEAGKGTS